MQGAAAISYYLLQKSTLQIQPFFCFSTLFQGIFSQYFYDCSLYFLKVQLVQFNLYKIL